MKTAKSFRDETAIRGEVRRFYAGRAIKGTGHAEGRPAAEEAARVGYGRADVESDYTEANLGLGCGNPIAIASLEPGEVVLDLGSGGGFDCFLAAAKVGERGQVIGVDMTPEMIARARGIAGRKRTPNVDFRLGEIEHLPCGDAAVDVVISNCVINLAPRKDRVFAEAFRVLRRGGRLAVADIIARRPVPAEVREDMESYVACTAGAVEAADLREMLSAAGFVDVKIDYLGDSPAGSPCDCRQDSGGEEDSYTTAAMIRARKP